MFVDNSWLCIAVINVATQAVRLSYSLFDTMLDVLYHVHKNVSQMFFFAIIVKIVHKIPSGLVT